MPQTTTLKLGDTAPAFSLPGVDGKTYRLEDFSSAKALCVIFMCNHCPYVKATIDRIIAIQRDYAGKGAQIVGINSNETVNHPEDSFDQMVRWAKEKSFNFPYLRDDSQDTARAYGAERTPHIFLFDQSRTLRYTGAIDDNPAIAPRPSAVGGTVEQEHSGGRDVAPIGAGVQVPRAVPVGLHTKEPANVKRHYLREAIDALLAGQPIKEAETPAMGCTVKWA